MDQENISVKYCGIINESKSYYLINLLIDNQYGELINFYIKNLRINGYNIDCSNGSASIENNSI